MSAAAKLADAVVALYPPTWRERYEPEYRTLLADRPLTWRTFSDALRGAFDAWAHPGELVAAPARRLRATASVVWCMWIAGAAGALVFAQSTEDQPFRDWDAAHPAARALYRVFVLAVHASALAILAGAVPVALALARRAWRAGEHRQLARIVVPALTPPAFLAAVVAISRLAHHSPAPGVGVGAKWFVALTALGLLAGLVCAAGPARALYHDTPPLPLLRAAVGAGALATVLMTVTAVASVAYEVGLHDGEPAFAAGYAEPWPLIAAYALVMGGACCVATISNGRAASALR